MLTLEAPDGTAAALADAAARDALLRCWVTEQRIELPAHGPLRLPVAGGTAQVTVRYRSVTGLHAFGPVRLGSSDVDAVRLAGLLVDADTEPHAAVAPDAGADLVARVADSRERIARYLADRAGRADDDADPFLAAERDLLLGHLSHPAAKSRDGLTDADDASYAPELRGRFPLHWFGVHRRLVAAEAVAGSTAMGGRGVLDLVGGYAGDLRPGRDMVAVPAHPWQARDLPTRPGFARLVDAGLVTPLGAAGPEWYPTSSLRTVYRPDAPVMLKLSLGLRITNSRREATRTELARGLEVCRLLDAGIDAPVRAAYPRFHIVRDPAYLAALSTDGATTGLDVSVREVPPGLSRTRCLAGLLAPQPGVRPARLVALLAEHAARTGRDVGTLACDWIRRYVDAVLAPMVLLYARTGIGLEAHQQNTLVLLDEHGWPVAGAYRDNQGYYLAESALPAVRALTGRTGSTLAVAADAVVDDRLTYYLLFNQALAPVSTVGAAGLCPEPRMLAALRAGLVALVERGHDTPRGLVRRWLTAGTLPRKANLATRLAGIDEVRAPVDHQSVYLPADNPLREVAR